jgi:hypothetical protein
MVAFVLDKQKNPPMPYSEKHTRLLLERGWAVIARRYPFTIRLRDWVGGETQLLRLNLDSGSRTPCLALVHEDKADAYLLHNPEVSGVAYQQGELAGYEVRKYLHEKRGRRCTYCDVGDVLLEIKHIVSKSRSGSNRASNLTLAYTDCNQAKGTEPLAVFLADKPNQLVRIEAIAKAPLQGVAAVNTTRWALFQAQQATSLMVETGTGGRTKVNRLPLNIPKTHALDAACVGSVATLLDWRRPVLSISATGRSSYKHTCLNRFGFPRGYLLRKRRIKAFVPVILSEPSYRAVRKPVHIPAVSPCAPQARLISKQQKTSSKVSAIGTAGSYAYSP